VCSNSTATRAARAGKNNRSNRLWGVNELDKRTNFEFNFSLPHLAACRIYHTPGSGDILSASGRSLLRSGEKNRHRNTFALRAEADKMFALSESFLNMFKITLDSRRKRAYPAIVERVQFYKETRL
jgi:hypothetical protein